mgnify:CR=1 FL=1
MNAMKKIRLFSVGQKLMTVIYMDGFGKVADRDTIFEIGSLEDTTYCVRLKALILKPAIDSEPLSLTERYAGQFLDSVACEKHFVCPT